MLRWLISVMWLCAAQTLWAQQTVMRVAIPDRTENFSSVPAMQALLSRAYARIGMTVEWVPMPLKRSESMLAAGLIDGELVRREAGPELASKTVRVRVPVMELSTAAFAIDTQWIVNRAEDLACCRVGINRNFRTSERLAVHARSIERAETLAELALMLKAGREDVIQGVYGSSNPPLSALGPDADPAIRVIARELVRAPGYHYLALRHGPVAEPLAEALLAEKSGRKQ